MTARLKALALAAKWGVRSHYSRHSGATWWTVERGVTVDSLEWMLNDKGRVKRFRSEQAANAALAAIEEESP